MTEPIHIISLGAGVQSSTMALMAACGEITPMPVAAIFADTHAEPQSVYTWLDWLEKQLPFPVVRVSKGDLTEAALKMRITKDGRKFTNCDIPYFTLSAKNQIGKIRQRRCTQDFKIAPIMRKIRSMVKPKRGTKDILAIQWIGISLDEVTRMKDARKPWVKNIWPLIDRRMSRHDCKEWMKSRRYPEPPRSACVYCPFHSNAEWRRLKNIEPYEFEKAVWFERKIQAAKQNDKKHASTPFLHRSCILLDQVVLSTEEERGQLDLWGNECEGMCGV